ncbi:hypothetical protein K504DRAFT_460761 [Pleomassaria siparia CBS 279.74]|uniref:Uncharacterized protein n=1 Tax=Pleomassaria siparia CBS 279.74 TaxID=1314801 RepID=A0A6G1JXJ2_9PLEO|nr:hypothetical protein K504DRAFT_460761 [Pleomassaria siparia CBS 279.74]
MIRTTPAGSGFSVSTPPTINQVSLYLVILSIHYYNTVDRSNYNHSRNIPSPGENWSFPEC